MAKSAPKEKVGWAYVRVSSVEQSNVLHGSLEQQQNSIERWAKEQEQRTGTPFKIVRYVEEDISGRKQSLHKRKDYHELVRAVKTGDIDFVVVEKVDRLNRNFVENRRFVEICQERNVQFYLRDGGLVDFKDRGSRLGYNIQSMIAEEYSLDLEEKITKKQREARVNNGKDSNTVPLLGLDNHPTKYGFYVINEEEQKIVQKMFKKFIECGDLVETAQFCQEHGYRTKARSTRERSGEGGIIVAPRRVGGDEFTPKNVRRILVSRKIAGFGYFEDTWNQFPLLQDENKMVRWQYGHPPVVDLELFEKAQRILAKNAKHDHRNYANRRTYILSGILFDQNGNTFHGHTVAGQHPYYESNGTKLRIPAKEIEKAVVDEVRKVYTESGVWERVLADTFKNSGHEITSIEEEIVATEKDLVKLDATLAYNDEAFMSAIGLGDVRLAGRLMVEKLKKEDQLRSKKTELENKLTMLKSKKDQILLISDKKPMAQFLEQAVKKFEESSSVTKKKVIQSVVSNVVVDVSNNQLRIQVSPFLRDKGVSVCDKEEKFYLRDKWRDEARSYEPFSSTFKLVGIIGFSHIPLHLDKFFLHEKYIKEGLSASKIAKLVFSSKSTIQNALAQFGIEAREPHLHHGNPSQAKFGEKVRQGKLELHLFEQRTIDVVKMLRDQGLTLRQIAKVLDKIKIPTKERGKKWHPEMVRRILIIF